MKKACPPKELNTRAVFALARGSMISSGLFILPALAYEKAGPADRGTFRPQIQSVRNFKELFRRQS